METAVDVSAVVEEGGRLSLDGLPFAVGREVRVHVEPIDERPPGELTAEEWIARMRRVAKEIHALHPNAPTLSDYAMSRESIYEDEGL